MQGGISLFLALARDDRAAEREASMACAALRLRLAGLCMGEMVLLRSQGVASWRKAYETVRAVTRSCQAARLQGVQMTHTYVCSGHSLQRRKRAFVAHFAGQVVRQSCPVLLLNATEVVVTLPLSKYFAAAPLLVLLPQATSLAGAAVMSLGAQEAGLPHAEALLVQACLMLQDPAPVKDLRPRLKKVEKVLQVRGREEGEGAADLDTRWRTGGLQSHLLWCTSFVVVHLIQCLWLLYELSHSAVRYRTPGYLCLAPYFHN